MERDQIAVSLRAVGDALRDFDNAVAGAIREQADRFTERTGLQITSFDVTRQPGTRDTYGRPLRPTGYTVVASVERFAK